MSVVIETTLGDITVDLFLKERPRASLNFLKLCKMKFYNYNLFHTISRGFIAQTGDPTGSRVEGGSIYGVLEGPLKRYFQSEKVPRIKHTHLGLLSFVGNEEGMIGSQFFITLGEDLTYLDEKHCVFGEIMEGLDVLELLNETICDNDNRPYQDVRITHTVILDDPFPDLQNMRPPSRSPSPTAERLHGGRIAADEDIDDTEGKSAAEIIEMLAEREAKARATILEMVGDLPDADMAPPENVLFVCKLNPVTTDDDLEIIFSRFGKIKSCEVIRDRKSGDSLQYAFVEFEEQKSCEDAYFKMDNVLIDDRRIHVDFSQSVSKIKWHGKGRGVTTYDDSGRKSRDIKNDLGKGKYKSQNKFNYENREENGKFRDDESNKNLNGTKDGKYPGRNKENSERFHKDFSWRTKENERRRGSSPKSRRDYFSEDEERRNNRRDNFEKNRNKEYYSSNRQRSYPKRYKENRKQDEYSARNRQSSLSEDEGSSRKQGRRSNDEFKKSSRNQKRSPDKRNRKDSSSNEETHEIREISKKKRNYSSNEDGQKRRKNRSDRSEKGQDDSSEENEKRINYAGRNKRNSPDDSRKDRRYLKEDRREYQDSKYSSYKSAEGSRSRKNYDKKKSSEDYEIRRAEDYNRKKYSEDYDRRRGVEDYNKKKYYEDSNKKKSYEDSYKKNTNPDARKHKYSEREVKKTESSSSSSDSSSEDEGKKERRRKKKSSSSSEESSEEDQKRRKKKKRKKSDSSD